LPETSQSNVVLTPLELELTRSIHWKRKTNVRKVNNLTLPKVGTTRTAVRREREIEVFEVQAMSMRAPFSGRTYSSPTLGSKFDPQFRTYILTRRTS
jgi:hypothetical protein